MSNRRELVRSRQWWGHKIPPVLGVAALAIGQGGVSGADLRDLVVLFVSMVGLAAFGHVVNDVSDIEADRRGGKANLMAGMDVAGRVRLVGLSLVVGLVPWVWLPARAGARAAVLAEFLLLVAYSKMRF
ncbi:MAG: hypothetical protein U0Q22_02540 [Acidimicrobiales bacterium]